MKRLTVGGLGEMDGKWAWMNKTRDIGDRHRAEDHFILNPHSKPPLFFNKTLALQGAL
jgi:hypothetical protein